ncbi:uncharacterized protein CTHT_0018770 [Thermochaetoides thermophila DSM 1495]|uniref:WSC domain-containing protein n=1 Tax=Chaetomium thermophilum (strain DSM 1495 / CBS 144.50 / IMI 039719) TaxID=759272 RepID=G0S2W9_CHATD|nr:hypothetical protein CTHT_0018770 [Thermochaetoides thermophila DSM 1495]EGS22352.1 hypothetical protein CTHT_0018770 [Thermochaetoides thermophila DSM 1495]
MKSVTLLAAALLAGAVDAISPERSDFFLFPRQKKGVQQPKQDPQLMVATNQGCYKSQGELIYNDTFIFNSIDLCATKTCYPAGYEVAASRAGKECFCGHKYPPKEDLVPDSQCNVGCGGYDLHACGGAETFSVYNTGKSLAVKHSEKTDEDEPTSTGKPTVTSTQGAAQTIIMTETAVVEPDKKGSNTAGIVAGVVVSVVLVIAAGTGVYLYLRRKRNKEIEEEHRRNAAVTAFMGKPGSSGGMSMTDSRLDPILAARRLSDGSIADNQDYSRRILRVVNT